MKQSLYRNFNSGFTLIEILIVVAIIGIIATFAVPTYQNYTGRAQLSEAINLASSFKLRVAECFNETGGLNGCNGGANGVPNDISNNAGKYADRISTAKGVITITMKSTDELVNCVKGATVVLSPNSSGDTTLVWSCTTTAECAPSSCPRVSQNNPSQNEK